MYVMSIIVKQNFDVAALDGDDEKYTSYLIHFALDSSNWNGHRDKISCKVCQKVLK